MDRRSAGLRNGGLSSSTSTRRHRIPPSIAALDSTRTPGSARASTALSRTCPSSGLSGSKSRRAAKNMSPATPAQGSTCRTHPRPRPVDINMTYTRRWCGNARGLGLVAPRTRCHLLSGNHHTVLPAPRRTLLVITFVVAVIAEYPFHVTRETVVSPGLLRLVRVHILPIWRMRHLYSVAVQAEGGSVTHRALFSVFLSPHRMPGLDPREPLRSGQPVGILVRIRFQRERGGMTNFTSPAGSLRVILGVTSKTLGHCGRTDSLLSVRRHFVALSTLGTRIKMESVRESVHQ